MPNVVPKASNKSGIVVAFEVTDPDPLLLNYVKLRVLSDIHLESCDWSGTRCCFVVLRSAHCNAPATRTLASVQKGRPRTGLIHFDPKCRRAGVLPRSRDSGSTLQDENQALTDSVRR